MTAIEMEELSGQDRAALAFSGLAIESARRVAGRLSFGDRARLREGLAHVRGADAWQRRNAMAALACAVRAEVTFPEPLEHSEEQCPFKRLESEPIARLAAAIEACSVRQPLVGAVALCHMESEFRARLWNALPTPARAAIRPSLHSVPVVTHARTRTYADQLRLMTRRLQRTD